MKLDPANTRKTDDQFYERYPKMVKDGKRIPIDPKNPDHNGLAEEWTRSYRQNESASKQSKPTTPSPPPPKPVGAPVCPCPDGNRPPAPPCCFQNVVVKCSHGERAYVMTLPLPPDKKDDNELHVIAGHTNADKVEVTLNGGPCNRGHAETPCVKSANVNRCPIQSTSKLTIEAFAPERSITQPGQWKSMIWPDVTSDCQTYPVNTTACEGASGCSTVLKAFPYVKWSIAAGFSLPGAPLTDKKKTGFSATKKGDQYDSKKFIEYSCKQNNWGGKYPTVTLELDGGNTKHELGGEYQSFIKDTATYMEDFKSFADLAGGFMHSMGGPDFSVQYPSIEIFYECETVEIKGTPRVGVQGTAELGLSPLIGLTFSYDVLEWLLGMANLYAPGLGKALIAVKQRAEKGYFHDSVKVELSLTFAINGSISGSLAWQKTDPSAKEWECLGEVDRTLDGSFIGKASAELDTWLFSAGAGAEVGGKTGVGAKVNAGEDPKGVFAEGRLYFSGVTVYYSVYVSAGTASKEPKSRTYEDKEGGTPRRKHKTGESSSSSGKAKTTEGEHYPLVEPGEWPKGGSSKWYIISNS